MTQTIQESLFSLTASGPNGDRVSVQFRDTIAASGLPVESPPLVPSPINLVRSSRNPSDGDNHWTLGFSYLPAEDGKLKILSECPSDSIGLSEPDVSIVNWQPYILQASFSCSMMGYNEADYTARARALLDAATPKMVEYEFWNGLLAQAASLPNLYLKKAVRQYAATSVNQAIGICEQYIAAVGYGGRGMIHAPAYLTPYLQMICRREGNLLLTYRDTIVVPGSGYLTDSFPPVLPPVGSIPLFVTGITDVRLGEIVPIPESGSFIQAVDRATNSVVVSAERYACASWDGVTLCRVDLTLPA